MVGAPFKMKFYKKRFIFAFLATTILFIPSVGKTQSVNIERRQWALGEGNSATATFSMAPTAGNLLVAMSKFKLVG